jgi:hypothetical protein
MSLFGYVGFSVKGDRVDWYTHRVVDSVTRQLWHRRAVLLGVVRRDSAECNTAQQVLPALRKAGHPV